MKDMPVYSICHMLGDDLSQNNRLDPPAPKLIFMTDCTQGGSRSEQVPPVKGAAGQRSG